MDAVVAPSYWTASHRDYRRERFLYKPFYFLLFSVNLLTLASAFVVSCSACDDQVNYSDKSKCHVTAPSCTVHLNLSFLESSSR